MVSKEIGVAQGSDFYVYTPGAQAKKIFLYPTSVGLFRYLPKYSLRRSSFDSFLIMLLHKGECEIESGGRTYHASAGQVILLNCYEPHAYWSFVGWEAQWLHFAGESAAGYYDAIVGGGSPLITLKNRGRFEKYLHRIYLQFRSHNTLKEAVLNNYIINILTELLVNKETTHAENTSADVIEDTIAYINEHLAEPLTLDDLAARASLSPFYFSRLFKKKTGFTPHSYVITARVNYAKFLLKSTSDSIKSICFCTGFSNESAFCTTFKKTAGCTPSEYRSLDHDLLYE